jgi:hypothetical protein
MKKLYATLIAVFAITQFSYGQNTFPASGNVGIGTVSPNYNLHVNKSTATLALDGITGGLGNSGAVINLLGWASSWKNWQIGVANIGPGGLNFTPSTTIGGSSFSSPVMTILDNGNVGIGTTAPARSLDINGWVQTNTGMLFNNTKAWDIAINGNNLYFDETGIRTPLTLLAGGSVGIGTTTPTGKFQVQQGSYDLLTSSTSVDIGLNSNTGGWSRAFRVVNASGSNGQNGGAFGVLGAGATPTYAYMAIPTSDPTGYDSSKILMLDNSGNVGIGTTNPAGYKLAVNGNAIATALTVKLYANWPDYVFKLEYHLPSLSEVKTYIDRNQHLPEMPTEAEVTKNGINLGEMNTLLTKKVEELTLYLIEKDKEIKDQQNLNSTQNERLKVLENRLEKLEAAQKNNN